MFHGHSTKKFCLDTFGPVFQTAWKSWGRMPEVSEGTVLNEVVYNCFKITVCRLAGRDLIAERCKVSHQDITLTH